MGCGSSTAIDIHRSNFSDHPSVIRKDPEFISIIDAWDNAQKSVDVNQEKKTSWFGKESEKEPLVIKRTGWKTIRIFVSSTFKDFHEEREILVKKVFPNLRSWCEPHRLYLVECDLRWGVPQDFNDQMTIRTCLGEIDRCYEDNVLPFFLNMTSQRVGWIPKLDQVPNQIQEDYQWIEGLSVTEMEIMHGAYRMDNPNALFMIRGDEYLSKLPSELKPDFQDNEDMASFKLKMLKDQINHKFSPQRLQQYDMVYDGMYDNSNKPKLKEVNNIFSDKVFAFFMKRISLQYPMPSADAIFCPYKHTLEQHESFMKSRSDSVFGRDDVIKEIERYIASTSVGAPFLLIGGAGSGKSSVISSVADNTIMKALQKKIPGCRGGKQSWKVFYHFVGAVPGSTELFTMLKRILIEMNVCKAETVPTSLETAVQLTCGSLANPNTDPMIIIVDALNQLDEESAAHLVSWVPKCLAPQIRCVFSCIDCTPQHASLTVRDQKPVVHSLQPLTRDSREEIVSQLLMKFGKLLDTKQMNALMNKESSKNPLWLSIAVEELRVYGDFRKVQQKIESLADGLLELEMEVLARFEQENGGELLIATLCLLEVSSRGLLETELLSILADTSSLMPPGTNHSTRRMSNTPAPLANLPASKWAVVYRALRPFLRPFGESGEGRLDFYHRSLSKAVRRKYFTNELGTEDRETKLWYHRKLANYFEQQKHNISRVIEEYPYHLIQINDCNRLEAFLVQWNVFDELFEEEFSYKLIHYWRQGSDLDAMKECYMVSLENLENNSTTTRDMLSRRLEELSELLVQAGHYEHANTLAKRAMHIEVDELNSRPERLSELYFLSAFVKDEVTISPSPPPPPSPSNAKRRPTHTNFTSPQEMKLQEFMYRSQLFSMRSIIEDYESAVKYCKMLKGKTAKSKHARSLNRLSFYYSGYSLRGGDSYLTASDAKTKALEVIEECIQMFKELDDEVHVADSMVTKGVAYGNAVPEQLAAYLEGYSIAQRIVGEYHSIMDRLHLNIAIHYEEKGEYYKAYGHFRQWYAVCIEMYGVEHPKTKRPVNTLNEPMYKRIAAEKGDSLL